LTEGCYAEIWAYWKNKFKDNETIFKSIRKVDAILENRLYTGALKGKYNSTITIFGLKNNYGWKDKTETDITTQGEKISNIPDWVHALKNGANDSEKS
jgi:hypothetical protein